MEPSCRVSVRRRRRTSVLWTLAVAAASVSILGACTGGVPAPGPTTGHPSTTFAGSGVAASSHFADTCAHARPVDGPFPAPEDLVIGVLSYAGARRAAHLASTQTPTPQDGATFYKTGAQLPAHTAATVRIVSPAASDATILTETGPEHGTRSVTYTNCTDTPQWWVGGFVLWGRQTGCVALEVTSSVDPEPKRGVVSLNAGTCPG